MLDISTGKHTQQRSLQNFVTTYFFCSQVNVEGLRYNSNRAAGVIKVPKTTMYAQRNGTLEERMKKLSYLQAKALDILWYVNEKRVKNDKCYSHWRGAN